MGKLPAAGRVKTRLTPRLSPEAAAGVHALFVGHTLDRLAELANAGVLARPVFCFDPPGEVEAAEALAAGRADVLPQSVGDLGDRLVAAAEAVDRPLLFLGCDSPDVPHGHVERAVALLEYDVVLGPCDDGGFWCLAVRPGVALSTLVRGVDWSSGRECGQVRANALTGGYTVTGAPAWSDVDRPADLAILWARLAAAPAGSADADLRAGLDRLVPRRVLRSLRSLRPESDPAHE